ncbi:MAG: hypothetical protein GXO42_00680 [bacterium]|nr:hypothetical protein [bacterium]
MPYQPLEAHIEGALKILDRLRGKKPLRYLEALTGEQNVEEWCALAVIFHDAGKALYRGYSFPGHEYLSTLLLDKYLWQLSVERSRQGGPLLNSVLQEAVIFAVLFHHHAMDPERRSRQLLKAVVSDTSTVALRSSALRQLLEKFLQQYCPVLYNEKALTTAIEYKYLQNLLQNRELLKTQCKNTAKQRAQDWIKRGNNEAKIYHVMLQILLVCDNLSVWYGLQPCEQSKSVLIARKVKSKQQKTRFQQVLDQWLEIYSSL